MPTGNLPAEGKKLYEEVYQKALKGSCDGDKACAAGSAWKAVKNAGWKKDKDGNWTKKAFVSFSLAITKAGLDKASNTMFWTACASDTEEDLAGDNMTLELFNDFVHRIETNELAPEQFRSNYWQGGMPYISISHYPDLDGDGVPGIVDAVFVDGNKLKAKGRFYDTALGQAAFKSVLSDLYGENKSREDKVRISIRFLDWKHIHKSDNFEFVRENLDEFCPRCLLDIIQGKNLGDRSFHKGQLEHLALTRVPMNERTNMEVERSMTTRKEDAESIVGEEEAENLEEKATLVGKSAVVVDKSKTPEPVVEEAKHGKDMEEEDMEDEEDGKKKKGKMKEEKSITSDPLAEIKSQLDELRSLLSPKPETPHILDAPISKLKADFDGALETDLSTEEKLQLLQDSFNDLANVIKSNIETPKTVEEAAEENKMAQAFSQVLAPMQEQLALLTAQMQEMSKAAPATEVRTSPVPAPRSINPALLQRAETQAQKTAFKISEIVQQTT